MKNSRCCSTQEHIASSGDNIFYKVMNDSSIILIDSFGNEPKKNMVKYYVLKRN